MPLVSLVSLPTPCTSTSKNTNMSSLSKKLYSLLHQKPKSFNHLKQIHALFITTNLKSPAILAKLIEHSFFLSPHQTPTHPHLILNHESDCQIFLLNTLIKCSLPQNSILLFSNWLSNSSIVFDDHTFIFALGACARSTSLLHEGEQVHGRAIKLGFMANLQVSTTTIHFYGSNDHINFAKKVFDEMPERSNVTWNALITGYSSQKQNSHENSVNALVTFKDMLLVDDSNVKVKPNGLTMVSVLSAVSQLGSVEVGSSVHGYIAKTIETPEKDVYVGTSLVDMYSKCGCLGIASKVFGTMKVRNVLTWTAMVTGFAFHGKGKEAMELLKEMRKCNVRPNLVTFTSVLSACCHAGLVEEGLILFHKMEKEFGVAPQVEHYGCVVDLLGKAGHLKEAYDFILDTYTQSNPVLWRSLLGSCRLHGDVVMGEKVGIVLLQLQLDVGFRDRNAPTEDYVALSNIYALARRWEDVGTVRDEMWNKGLEIKPGRSAVCTLNNELI